MFYTLHCINRIIFLALMLTKIIPDYSRLKHTDATTCSMRKRPVEWKTYLGGFASRVVTANRVIEQTDGHSIGAFERNKMLTISDLGSNGSTGGGTLGGRLEDVEIHKLSDLRLVRLNVVARGSAGHVTLVEYAFDELWIKGSADGLPGGGGGGAGRDRFAMKLLDGRFTVEHAHAARVFKMRVSFARDEGGAADDRLTETVREYLKRFGRVAFPSAGLPDSVFHHGPARRLAREMSAALTFVPADLMTPGAPTYECRFDDDGGEGEGDGHGHGDRGRSMVFGRVEFGPLQRLVNGKIVDRVMLRKVADRFATQFVVSFDRLRWTSDAVVNMSDTVAYSARSVEFRLDRLRADVFYRRRNQRLYEVVVDAAGLELEARGQMSYGAVDFVRRKLPACLRESVARGLEKVLYESAASDANAVLRG